MYGLVAPELAVSRKLPAGSTLTHAVYPQLGPCCYFWFFHLSLDSLLHLHITNLAFLSSPVEANFTSQDCVPEMPIFSLCTVFLIRLSCAPSFTPHVEATLFSDVRLSCRACKRQSPGSFTQPVWFIKAQSRIETVAILITIPTLRNSLLNFNNISSLGSSREL